MEDANALQRDLLSLEAWCNSNDLYFNLSKCNNIRVSKKKNVFVNNYTLNGALPSADSIRDLGVTFRSDLSFESHIQLIGNRTFKTLGFILRSSKYFKNINTL